MQTHNVQRDTKNKKHTQLGRGGRHGKTSGRGGKGQTARAGNKRRPQMRDVIKKLPKLRGYKFASIQTPAMPVNLDSISNAFTAGAVVSPVTLLECGVIKTKNGRVPRVKILARGEMKIKVTVTGCLVSETAKQAIEKAGGKVEESK
ncbi:MAG: uL15m family ribosomal protein [bacterium]